MMKKGEKLVIVGCSGSGGPAAIMSKKLMPDVDVTVIRKEECHNISADRFVFRTWFDPSYTDT